MSLEPEGRALRLELAALLVGLAAVATANLAAPSLPSLDDCFYARKGVEMARRGEFFTVTWNDTPTFQNPPLQVWILGRSFRWLGENDAAARVPSVLMALGIALAVYGIGRMTLGATEAVTGTALLLATPVFANNARRCMMEIPLTFWVCLAVLVFLAGLKRPWLHLLLALSIGAGVLTKSVLGLLPLLIIGAATASPPARAALRSPWLWLGTLGGVAIAASWPIHQALAIGTHAVRDHFLGEVISRAAAPMPWWRHFTGYPAILLERFQPAVLPGLAGAVLIWRNWRRTSEVAIALVGWVSIPLVLYSLSSAQTPRYVFPLLPALALLGGAWLARRWPHVATITRRAVAVLLFVAAGVFWVRPELLRQPGNDALKQAAATVMAAVPAGQQIPYSGSRYWIVANPFLYYTERLVQAPTPTAEAVQAARQRASVLLLDRDRLPELSQPYEAVVEGRNWVLARLRGPGT